jgi:hypothetical protein
MISTATKIEDLALNIAEEIHVRAGGTDVRRAAGTARTVQ